MEENNVQDVEVQETVTETEVEKEKEQEKKIHSRGVKQNSCKRKKQMGKES